MPDKVEIHECYFCKTVVTEDNYCRGCGNYICEYCDQATSPLGKGHATENHKLNDDRYYDQYRDRWEEMDDDSRDDVHEAWGETSFPGGR